jgi:hypothetical protein
LYVVVTVVKLARKRPMHRALLVTRASRSRGRHGDRVAASGLVDGERRVARTVKTTPKAKAAIASATPIHAAPCMRRPFSPACGCRGIAVRSHTAGAPRKFPDRGPRRRARSQERGAEAHEEYRVADGHERCGLPRKLRLRSKHHTLN